MSRAGYPPCHQPPPINALPANDQAIWTNIWLVAFVFEHFNGMLEKVNLNGHDGGRMEVTLLCNWIQTHLLYEYLLSLPKDAHELERKILDQIVKDEGKQGGMVTQIAVFRSEASTGIHTETLLFSSC